MSNNKKLTNFHYNEASNKTFLIINFAEETLTQHPVYLEHKILGDKLNNIIDEFNDIYQTLGNLNHSKTGLNQLTDNEGTTK